VTRRYPTFRAFAEASVDDLFGDRWLGRARVLETVEMASGVFVQAPDGRFSFRAFPREAQLAPLNAMVAADFDGDGNVDLLAAGNSHAPEPTTGRFDGGVGVVLKGDGRGGFTALSPAEAGVVATGEVRAAALLADAAGLRVVVARNEGSLLLFEKR
jgi:hypothetical protein